VSAATQIIGLMQRARDCLVIQCQDLQKRYQQAEAKIAGCLVFAARYLICLGLLWGLPAAIWLLDWWYETAFHTTAISVFAIAAGTFAAAIVPLRAGTWDRYVAPFVGLVSFASSWGSSVRPALTIALIERVQRGQTLALVDFTVSPHVLGGVLSLAALGLLLHRWLRVPMAGAGKASQLAVSALFDLYGRKNRVLAQLGVAMIAQACLVVWTVPFVDTDGYIWRARAAWFVCGAMVTAALIGITATRLERLRLAGVATLPFAYAIMAVVLPNYQHHAALASNPRSFLVTLMEMDLFISGATVLGLTCGGLLIKAAYEGDENVKRPWDQVLGAARWMTMREARKQFPASGYVVVGEAYRPDLERRGTDEFIPTDKRTWGQGGKADILAYDMSFDSTHMLFFAGSGGYKTTSTVIPTARRYPGSMVVLDPAQEIGDMVAPVRRRMTGPDGKPRRVVILDPMSNPVSGCDVLKPFRAMGVRQKTLIVGAYAKMLLDEKSQAGSGSDQFFEQNTEKLVSGLLMYACYCETKSLPFQNGTDTITMQHYASLALMPEADLQKLIKVVCDNAGEPGSRGTGGYIGDADARQFIKYQLGAFSTMEPKQWSSIAATVSGCARWLSKAPLVEMVCGNDFSLDEFAVGGLDVFIQLKGDTLKENKGLVRLLIGTMFKVMLEREGKSPKVPVLFVLDEVDLLGYMSALEEARDRGRKYAISLMLLYQSIGQLEKHFGKESAGAWFDSAAIVSYAAVKSKESATAISDTVGEMTVIVENTSQSASWRDGIFSRATSQNARVTKSENLQKRALLLAHEVREMRSDEQIIFVRGKPALRCGRAIFFRRPEMLEGIGKSRVRDGGADTPIFIEPAQASNSAPATRTAAALPPKAARVEMQAQAPLSDDSEEPAPPRYAGLGSAATGGHGTLGSVTKLIPATAVSNEIDRVVAPPLSDEATGYLWLVGLAPAPAPADLEALRTELDSWARVISEDHLDDARHRAEASLLTV
jgi:type IV secretion system protein VirD4